MIVKPEDGDLKPEGDARRSVDSAFVCFGVFRHGYKDGDQLIRFIPDRVN